MRQLTDKETETARAYYDPERCKGCRYPARIDGRQQCGMVYYNCVVTKPVCLEVK